MKKFNLLAVAALLFFSCSQSKPELNSVKSPSMDPPGGKYSTEQYVNISPREDGGVVYYTTDGSIPSASNGLPYENSLYVSNSNSPLTIYAVTVKDGETSEVVGGEYFIGQSLSSIISAIPFTGESISLYGVIVTGVDPSNFTRFIVQERPIQNTGMNGPMVTTRAILVDAGITGVSVGNTLDLIVQAGSGGSGAWDTITAATLESNDGGNTSITKASLDLDSWYGLSAENESRIANGNSFVVRENTGTDYDLLSNGGYTYRFTSTSFSTAPAMNNKVSVSAAYLMEEMGPTWLFFANPSDVTVTEDTTAPMLSSSSPADGTTNVSTGSYIYFYFDEQIDPATAIASAIIISPDPGGNVQYIWYGRAVYFVPSTSLTANTLYTVSIPATNIEDYAGNAFGGASITFKTSP